MKVAIIGAGISGLTCAYLLQDTAEITVFEAADEIGGHTATKRVNLYGQNYDIDTGFIVFNDWTYPNFIRLLDKLQVESQPTEMSFSVSCELSGLEYSGSNLNTLFAQRSNLLRPKFWNMLRDIIRFNREAVEDLDNGVIGPGTSLGQYLGEKGYGRAFAEKYLVPMGSAIWSASTDTMMNFPLQFFVRFFRNHGLLSVNNRPQWRVIKGGSKSYLKPLTQGFSNQIETGSVIERVERFPNSVELVFKNGDRQSFDQVVLACHSDQALALLCDPSAGERSVLGAMPYQRNEVVLHTDARHLPARRRAWASWNYRIREQNQQSAVLTYNMNILQGLEAAETFCVTLNDSEQIDPESILGKYNYSHPVFSLESVAASERWEEINGVNRTWFCGAYWANGFHEDGCSSGIRVAQKLGADW
ncbi:FAD-dependent oxidoreductase [Pseudomaricurvus alkylphenolicus]|uniref:NAD(P)/FAD-dependent oxidoreductase n=1 Tax=Pseudomaricurvus alkylphenolicus TaxID=1306991 RepID=UPI00141F881A|nr:FAD-dependent oxidoreductase [Pseudomaricurvus alkylphenolicus]NIB43059.1 FAD-dependent oxidoreductase [Pseudomaricurvus alkylphenolicus]